VKNLSIFNVSPRTEFVLKWLAFAFIILATLLTSFDVNPANKYFFLTGTLLWTWVGLIWRQPSVWALNLFCVIVYILGLIDWSFLGLSI